MWANTKLQIGKAKGHFINCMQNDSNDISENLAKNS